MGILHVVDGQAPARDPAAAQPYAQGQSFTVSIEKQYAKLIRTRYLCIESMFGIGFTGEKVWFVLWNLPRSR